MASKKLILFFSNRCKFSQNVIEKLKLSSLSEDTLIVCVEKYRNIPAFVQQVPLLYNQDTREVYIEDSLDALLQDSMSQKIEMTTYNDNANSFCFIDDNGVSVCSSSSWMAIDDMSRPQISFVDDSESASKSRKADSAAMLEKFMAQRDADLRVLNTQNSNWCTLDN